jgi:O-acetyl-ADP-ribose deacetylase (regulator of RNase III)
MNKDIVKTFGKVNIYVIEGDITQIQTPAIMTAINSGGLWFGGVDYAIKNVAGSYYHSQASEAMPLHNLQTVIAKGDARKHTGKFNDVVFVVDDLKSSLDKVVFNGLEAAHNEGYTKLLVPAMRMGVMAGLVEKTPQETVTKLSLGINQFVKAYGDQTKLENLTFVVYRDPNAVSQLKGL